MDLGWKSQRPNWMTSLAVSRLKKEGVPSEDERMQVRHLVYKMKMCKRYSLGAL